jgi:hypothetical protein
LPSARRTSILYLLAAGRALFAITEWASEWAAAVTA